MGRYVGEADAAMDDKSRLTLPKEFRDALPKGPNGELAVWVTPGYQGAVLCLRDDEDGGKWVDSISALTQQTGGKYAGLKRVLHFCKRVEIDKAGRILVPQRVLDLMKAGSAREFTVAGEGNVLSVYERGAFADRQAELTRDGIDRLYDLIADASGANTSAPAGMPMIEGLPSL